MEPKPIPETLFLLFCATVLEAGGDLLINKSLLTTNQTFQPILLVLGAIFLIAYGWQFNNSGVDYGFAAAIYSTMVFFSFQIVNSLTNTHRLPNTSTWIASIFMLAGGLIALAGKIQPKWWPFS
jgi:hypothetical protein